MIDSQGRIFGKINIIDLFVVVMICATFGLVGFRFLSPQVVTSVSRDDVIIKFHTESVNNFVAEALNIGDVLTDESRNTPLGIITGLNFGEGYMYVADSEGRLVASARENYSEVEITAELQAQFFENGIIVDGNIYGVGHLFVVRAGKTKIYGTLSSIERKET